MKLTPRELEGLLIHQAGFLAQKRLARGLKLNHPEATALISAQVRARRHRSSVVFIRFQFARLRFIFGLRYSENTVIFAIQERKRKLVGSDISVERL